MINDLAGFHCLGILADAASLLAPLLLFVGT